MAIDNTGIWHKISDIPTFYTMREQRNYDPQSKEWYYPFPTSSTIFDTSLLIPDLQKSFVNDVLERLWNAQVRNPSKQWTLIILEEAQLFMWNIRGSVAQNLLRICSVGRNQGIRTLAITVDLALIDASFIRLTSQRYYGRLNIEENSKRKFRNYHGLDWCRIAQELDLGYFIYLLRDKLKIVHVPLFQPKRLPAPYTPRIIEQPKPKPLWQRIKEFFFGTSKYRKVGGQNAMRVLWQGDKQSRIWERKIWLLWWMHGRFNDRRGRRTLGNVKMTEKPNEKVGWYEYQAR